MTTLEALEADLSLWGDPAGVLVQTAREIALAIDRGPSPQELTRLSTELRLLLKAIKDELRPRTTELDEALSRLRATEFDGG